MTEVFSDRVKALDLPLDQFVVVGSGVLDQLGIRKADDIDLVASKQLFEAMPVNDSWQKVHKDSGDCFMTVDGESELWSTWPYLDSELRFEDFELENIDDVNFATLSFTRNWKHQSGRDKDLEDIKLIDQYIKEQVS